MVQNESSDGLGDLKKQRTLKDCIKLQRKCSLQHFISKRKEDYCVHEANTTPGLFMTMKECYNMIIKSCIKLSLHYFSFFLDTTQLDF